jgi:N-acetylglutamate synthase-like GNAT family acetyltransferase
MRVKRVTSADIDSTYCCASTIPPAWADLLKESREWFKVNLGKHVEGYHLLDDGKVVGHIYYAASENAIMPYEVEPNVACIYCTEMLKEYLHKGYGKIMFGYARADLKAQGSKGMMVAATEFKEFMHHELFLKQGFKTIQEHSPFRIMYYPLNQESIRVRILPLGYSPSKDKVEVTLFKNFFCAVSPYMYRLIERVAQSFGDKVKLVEIEATPQTVRKYGTEGPLINGKIKLFGPASEEQVRKAIQEEIDKFSEV